MKKNQITLLVLLFIGCVSFTYAEQTTIKVLAIGNSFSEDAVENYLYNLGISGDVNFIIGNAYIGGCSLATHWSNASSNNAAYSYRKFVNGIKTTTASQTLLTCITDENWDYITFQQVSTTSGVLSTYFPYLTNLTNYVKENSTNPNVKFASHMTWAYPQASTKNEFGTNYNSDQMTMYNAIVNTVWSAAEQVGIYMVIPSGTAIQNGRSSHVNDSIEIGNTVNDNFNRDGSHLSLTLGRFTASCTWYEKLTGKSVVDNTYRPANLSSFKTKIAKNAAHLAVQNPQTVTDMQGYGEEDYNPLEFNVSLKIIDKTMGDRTKGSNDGKNLVAGLSSKLRFQGFGTDAWYYPLFAMTGANAKLIKNDTAWIWSATIKATEGTYYWYPAAKSLSYKNINKRILYYGESDNLTFTVSETGEVSGTTELLINNSPTDVLLKVIDKSKGALTNGTAELNEKNVYIEGGKPSTPDTRVATSLDAEYIIPTVGINELHLFPDQGNLLVKNDTAWIWSSTVKVRSGNYTWLPKLKSTSMAINSAGVMQFNVDLEGNISGQTNFVIDAINSISSYNEFVPFFVKHNYSNRSLSISGNFNSFELFNVLGYRLLEKESTYFGINIDISKFPSGIYLLLVDKKYSHKIIL